MPFMFEVQEPDNSPKGSNAMWHMLLPNNPEGYRMIYTPRATTTMTQGGVYEDNIGLAPPKFQINGVFGIAGTTLIGVAKSLEKEKKDGMQLYHEFEQNMLSFYERFGTYRMDGTEHTFEDATSVTGFGMTETYKPELKFYNFCDQEFWVVQINQFTLQRNTQRRHLYQYDIQMTGLRRLGKSDKHLKEGDLLQQMYQAKKLRDPKDAEKKVSAFESFMNGMKNLTGKMGALMGKVEALKSQMTQISTAVANFKNGLTELVHAPLDLVKTALATVDSIINSINDIGDLPHEFLNDMREVKRLLMSYGKKPELFSIPTTSTSNVAKGATETQDKKEILTKDVKLTATAAESFTNMNIPEETIFANEDTTKPVAIRQQAIKDNDTILTIAAKTGADWKQIASVNNLEYPFIVQTVEQQLTPALAYGRLARSTKPTGALLAIEGIAPVSGQKLLIAGITIVEVEAIQYGEVVITAPIGKSYYEGETVTLHQQQLAVVKAGDTISIPGDKTSATTPIANSQSTFEEQMYGIDEALDVEGNMPDQGTGDIVLAKGMDNMEMQLRHRMMTLRGELTELGHPEYGSLVPTFIGKANTPVWQERILIECQLTVLDDPRVDRLANTTFVIDNTGVFFAADVYLVGQGNPLQISLPIA